MEKNKITNVKASKVNIPADYYTEKRPVGRPREPETVVRSYRCRPCEVENIRAAIRKVINELRKK